MFLSDYAAVDAFMSKLSTDPALLHKINMLWQKFLQTLEARIEPDLQTDPDEKRKTMNIGTKKPLHQYLYKEDFDPFVRLLESEGVHDKEVHFMLGNFYGSVINLIVNRILPTLAAAKTPPADPQGTIINLFGGKDMPQA